MVKQLIKHGDGLALVIDKAILDLLNIDVDTPLDISTDGDVLIISPMRDKKRQEKFKGAVEKVNRRYSATFKRLAQ